jgi:hypothetical protein
MNVKFVKQISINFSNMNVKCDSEDHTNNNRPTGKITQRRITEKGHCGKKKHILDDSFINITPSLMKLKTRTQIKFFRWRYADSAA